MKLRIVTYNILNGGEGRETLIADVLAATRGDVVVLQEVYDNGFLPHLGQVLGLQAYVLPGNARRRVALLSRLPVRKVSSERHYPPISRNVVLATIQVTNNRTLHITGVHPTANLWIASEIWRWWEAHYILSRAAVKSTEWNVLAGDLNAVAPGDRVTVAGMPSWLRWLLWSQGKRTFGFSIRAYRAAALTDAFRHLHALDDGFTLPSDQPNARLDYIFVNTSLLPYLRHCEVLRSPAAVQTASDHCPVWAEFDLPD